LRAFAIFAVLSLAAFAVNAQHAELAGLASTTDGGVLRDVAVTVRDPATGARRTATTSEDGLYAMAGLRPGTYIVTFERPGFTTIHHRDIALRLGQTTQINATLQPSVSEQMTVTSSGYLIDISTKQLGASITADEFRDLPSQNRSFVLFAGLVPGVIPNPQTDSSSSDALAINGQHQANNSFRVDGVANDDPVVGSQSGAQVRTAIEAIQELQVVTSQFDAELGGATGGVLNAITKSGTNDVKASVFAFFQDARWNARDYFAERDDLPRTDASYGSAGFTLGGPLLRDRLHYFLSVERTTDREGHTRVFVSRPDLGYSTTEDNEIRNMLVRGDWNVTQEHHLSMRYLAEDAPQQNKIVGARTALAGAREEHDRDMNAIAGLESVPREDLFNNLRASYNSEHFINAASPSGEWASDFSRLRALAPLQVRLSLDEGPSTLGQDQANETFDVSDTFSWLLPRHELRGGVQWARRAIALTEYGTANGRFDFDTDVAFDPAVIATYPNSFNLRVYGAATADIRNIDTLGLFVQDEWHPRNDLTLSAGLRWDRDDAVDDRDNFAPRLGFAWSPGRVVFRAGAGRFYDQTRLARWSQPVRDALRLTTGFDVRVPDAGRNRQYFFDLAQANGITTLVGLRNLLAQMLEQQTSTRLNLSPTVDHRDRVQPYVDTITFGAQAEVTSNVAIGVDLIRTDSRDTLLFVDLNPFSRSRGSRPDISIVDGQVVKMGTINTLVNAGSGRYSAVQLSLSRRMSRRIGGRIAYTYADSEGTYGNAGPLGAPNTAYFQTRSETGYNFDTGGIIGEPLRLNLDDPRNQQPVGWYRRHNFVLAGVWTPMTPVSLSWIYRYMSGDRFTILTTTLLDNGNRAPAPPGTYGTDVKFAGTMFGAENPDFSRLDLRVSYTIPLRYRDAQWTITADMFNAMNRANFVNAGGAITGTAAFLSPTGTFSPRQFQFGTRLAF